MSSTADARPGAGRVTLRYWASARAAAGSEEDVVEVAGARTLAELKREALARHRDSPRFSDVLATCSVLVGDRPVATDDPESVLVPPGATVEFLPPFAGG